MTQEQSTFTFTGTRDQVDALTRQALEFSKPKAKADPFADAVKKVVSTGWVSMDPYAVLAPAKKPVEKYTGPDLHRRNYPGCPVCLPIWERKDREEAEAKAAEKREAARLAIIAEQNAKERAAKVAREKTRAQQRTAVTQSMAVIERALNQLPATAHDIHKHLRNVGFQFHINGPKTQFDYMEGTALARFLKEEIRRAKFDSALPEVKVQTYGGLGEVRVTSGDYAMMFRLEGGLAQYLKNFVEGKYPDSVYPY